jgi:hypothetical protein
MVTVYRLLDKHDKFKTPELMWLIATEYLTALQMMETTTELVLTPELHSSGPYGYVKYSHSSIIKLI